MAAANIGRRRLSLLLCGLSAASCILLMAGVLLFYGTPYNPLWWWIMGAIVVAAAVLPLSLVMAIEWVMAGYRSQGRE